MPKILLIETSTDLCSVALAQDGKVLSSRESDAPRRHASLTAVYIKEVLDEAGVKAGSCDAVCVSSGPGSYTGLRVGSSSAKGICFAAGIPLLSVTSLDILVAGAISRGLVTPGTTRIIPLIDARRMEVYTATYSPEGERLSDIAPLIIDENSFAGELSTGRVLFIGDGAAKCKGVITSPAAAFESDYPRAAAMAGLAEEAYSAGRFEDTAYFEPFYLKQFVATVSKKKLF